MKEPKMKDFSEMSKGDIRYWLDWARKEIFEYDEFIAELLKELRQRDKLTPKGE